MTEVRIQPWPLPTIPGQSTNIGDEGGGNVVYIETGSLSISCMIKTQGSGYNFGKLFSNGLSVDVYSLEVIDITGLSVIEEVEVIDDIVMTGTNRSGKPMVVTFKKGTKVSYSVGANVNRKIHARMTPEVLVDGIAVDGDEFSAYPEGRNGTIGFTIKVVNAMGQVLQKKTITKTEQFSVSEQWS